MKISPEMAEFLYKENMKLKKEVKELKEDNAFIKHCLHLALSRTGYTLVVEKDDIFNNSEIEFDLDENIAHDLIVKAKKNKDDWEFWKK